MNDLERFRAELWEQLVQNAEGLTGLEVLEAFKEISDDLQHSGLDEAWEASRVEDLDNAGHAFDCVWIALLSAKLYQKKRPR